MVRQANVTNIDAILAQSQSAIEEEIGRVREALSSSPGQASCSTLTPPEIRVFQLMGLGMSNREIARSLLIGLETVKTYQERLRDKCAVRGRRRLVAISARISAEGMEA